MRNVRPRMESALLDASSVSSARRQTPAVAAHEHDGQCRLAVSATTWVCALFLAFALLGPSGGNAQAQVVTEFSSGITASASPLGITAGPDGNLWFTEYSGHRIGRITPLGAVTEFSAGITAGARPVGIASGPDGDLWFAEDDGNRVNGFFR